MKALGASSLVGFTGYAGAQQGQQDQQVDDDSPSNQEGMSGHVPMINIPVINGYYDGDEVWFMHIDVSEQQMAEMMTEMINHPTHHAPALADAVDVNEAAPMYVFTNGIDHSGEEPWGGGPFNYQIDILDSVPNDDGYTSLRNPYRVTWEDDASPEILESEESVLDAEDAGELTIEQTEVIVTAPVVNWPGGPGDVQTGMGASDMADMDDESGMTEQCPMCDGNGDDCPMHDENEGMESDCPMHDNESP